MKGLGGLILRPHSTILNDMTFFLAVATNFLRTVAGNVTKLLAIETLEFVFTSTLGSIGNSDRLRSGFLMGHTKLCGQMRLFT